MKKLFTLIGLLVLVSGSVAMACPLSGGKSSGSATAAVEGADAGEAHSHG